MSEVGRNLRMGNKRRRNEENPREVAKLVKTTSFGVCTRAKSMALKGSMAVNRSIDNDNVGDGCYLHLRSRRLERYPPLFVKKAMKKECVHLDEKENVGVLKFEEKCKDKGKIAFAENEGENRMVEKQDKEFTKNIQQQDDYSFGENDLDFQNKQSRESTPSSFIMGKDEITTPTSSSNKATTINQITNPILPTLQDLEDFFVDAEEHRIHKFIHKYNFDIEKEKPFKGRFEWVKIKP